MKDLERLLKKEEEEKTEMANLYRKMIESKGHQIRNLLAKENELKEEQEILKDKLGEALCCVKDMEKLLKEEQDMKIDMEKRWQLDILGKNQELDMRRQKCRESDERLRYLEEKLGEALNEVQKLGLSLKKAEDSIMETGRLLLKEKDKEIEKLQQLEQDLREKLLKKEEECESLSIRGNELEILLNTEKELLKEKGKEASWLAN
ncbi:golgin subfamily A member 6-like protein 22 [Macrobrachium rosenbergii]|uniref:golgin subfamily A member 6-like protein 22 n=1 Tax=Macrobrachium rosenbergii TaxID=79674 RepID=UPI0034D4AA86